MKIETDTTKIEELKRKLAAARDGLKNDGVAMRQVAIFLDRWVQKNFQSSGSEVGGWSPYTYGGRLTTKRKGNAKSIEGRKWINGSAKLLMDTGALRLSFLPFIRQGSAGIGSDLPYSEPHEHGSKNVPQRRILPRDDEVKADVVEILDNFILFRLGGAR